MYIIYLFDSFYAACLLYFGIHGKSLEQSWNFSKGYECRGFVMDVLLVGCCVERERT